MTDSRDEQVENAAKAMWAIPERGVWENARDSARDTYRKMARAALPHFQQTADAELQAKAAVAQPCTETAQDVYTLAEIEKAIRSMWPQLWTHSPLEEILTMIRQRLTRSDAGRARVVVTSDDFYCRVVLDGVVVPEVSFKGCHAKQNAERYAAGLRAEIEAGGK